MFKTFLKSILAVSIAGALMHSAPIYAKGVFGVAMRADAKYGENTKHFDWADPSAKKGGVFNYGVRGADFDTLNPFTLKGNPPAFLGGEEFVFEVLMMRSLDEPFAQYGLLAEKAVLAKDEMSVTFMLNKLARFSDGKPVTSADVVYSFNTLISDKAIPSFKYYYEDVGSVKAIDKYTVKFIFKKKNPELHMILGQLSIMPKHIYSKGDFAKDFTKKAIGSGPYLVEKYEFGKNIIYKKNPNYWANRLPISNGKFNFEKVVVKYYKDQTVWFEGFKAGEIDFAYINSSKQWAVDVAGDRWDKKWIKKEMLTHKQNEGGQGFVFNSRKKYFQDRKIRKALAIALDFQHMNKTLFYEQYTPSVSFFNNSELAARNLPKGEELKLLEPLKKDLAPEVFTEPMGKPLGQGLDRRQRLIAAKKLIDSAGWKIKDGIYTSPDGTKLQFTVLLYSKSWERIVEPYTRDLEKIGVKADLRIIDYSIFEKKMTAFDYDMIVYTYGQSESPGNEQRNYWGSAARDKQGSRNYSGVNSKAIDFLIEKVVDAPSRKELVIATRALDRALWNEYILVPHWYIPAYRVTYWNKFKIPKTFPAFGSPTNFFLYYGWIDQEKDKKLKKAMKTGTMM